MTGRQLRFMTLIDEFTRSRASANLTIPCHTGPAVQIEPNLRSQSPKNGNISNLRRRLSAFSPQSCAIWESGDGLQIHKNPQLAGVYAICDLTISSCRTAWLGREDSNLRMVESKSAAIMRSVCARGLTNAKLGTLHLSHRTRQRDLSIAVGRLEQSEGSE